MSDINRSPMLSLVAQFDDLGRISEQLNYGIEDECLKAIEAQYHHLQRFRAVQKELDSKDHEIAKLKKEYNILDTKLKHARSLFETEMQKRIKAEEAKKSLERQITLIKEVLLSDQGALNDNAKEKLAFLSYSPSVRNVIDISPRPLTIVEESIGSLLSPSDVSFDKTDEDLDAEVVVSRTRSKRGRSSTRTNMKKPKLHDFFDEQEFTTTESFENDSPGNENKTQSRKTRSKCPSEPAPTHTVISPASHIFKSAKSESDPVEILPKNVSVPETPDRTSTGSLPFRRFSSMGRMNKNHAFVTKVLIRPEKCHPCGEKIQYFKQAFKCQDCRLTCHSECRDRVGLPCYPSTPTPSGKMGMGTISDYAPTHPPMIPAILVHCINEIESRGLEQVGLYRVSGSEREVREIKEKFLKGKIIPSLSKNDIHAVCGTVKEFLRSLSEPLITRCLWRTFVNASEAHTPNEEGESSPICTAINSLPQPNRDTLAFLIIHLHCVAGSPKCLMPLENLCKIFAPTIIGYSESDLAATDMLLETKLQHKAMRMLLKIPPDFWRNFVCNDNVFHTSSATSETITDSNRLGPITRNGMSSYHSRGVILAKTTLTPRTEVLGTRRHKKPYFASPLLK